VALRTYWVCAADQVPLRHATLEQTNQSTQNIRGHPDPILAFLTGLRFVTHPMGVSQTVVGLLTVGYFHNKAHFSINHDFFGSCVCHFTGKISRRGSAARHI
jgi:hypothetical protein